MWTRNFLILCSLAVLLVQADSTVNNDLTAQAKATDKESASDEAPTGSLNAISSYQPKDLSSTSTEVGQDAPKPNGVTGPGLTANSVEEQDGKTL
ncbi:hypothetical protein DPEC_G00286760 [Dallia pectoralis]|uniref:Uncharacterized protein n=1 Tax=Dallia pectoralis TaxID=75939 RepID=A0ACC2FK10_DALPE|nr:hypothetical protein DPEC_G00286760 [Dallia pectoralis]